MKYIFTKGLIAVDGVSLTVLQPFCCQLHLQLGFMQAAFLPRASPNAGMLQVGEVTSSGFCVYLIPETLRTTNLGAKHEGDSVNLEIEAQTQVCASAAACAGCLPARPVPAAV